ncbi:hypothetical protein FQA39_LY14278 [Lamprigera yunnana]|nr:hypothetical protein FQA39_LY14278 [Lamprigera yunnana]
MGTLLLASLALLCAANADVKHVLDGTAPLPPCYQDHQQKHVGEVANGIAPGSVDFWWAGSNSPFKQAYEYFKKCSSKNNCLPPVAPAFQAPVAEAAQTETHEFGKEHFEKNAFLNGQIQNVGAVSRSKIDLSQNPFLNQGMQAAYSSTGHAVTTGSDGFLGVQPSVPFSHTQPDARCLGVCVEKSSCVEGGQRAGQCGANEVCCELSNGAAFVAQYSNLSHIASSKASSGSVIKFDASTGISPGSIQVISDNSPIPNPLVNPAFKGGNNPSNTIKVIRNTYNKNNVFASTIDYSNDNFADFSHESAFAGPEYLPPISYPTKPPQIHISTNEYLPPTASVHIPTNTNVNNQYVFPPQTNPPPHIIYQPTTTQKPTPGYQYPEPTPTLGYPKPIEPQHTNINNQYVTKPSSPKPTPGYNYPQPTPPFGYPSTPQPFNPSTVRPSISTANPFAPSPSSFKPFVHPQPSISTANPFAPSPSSFKPFVHPQPSIPSANPFAPSPSSFKPFVHPQPSIPTAKPFVPSPSSFKPFVHPQPSVFTTKPFGPTPSSIKPFLPVAPSISTYKPSFPSTIRPQKPFVPVKNGYSYPTPHPPFTIPPYQPQPSNVGNVYQSSPKPSTINQYLPPIRTSPEPNLETGESNSGVNVVRPPYNPPQIPAQPNEPIASFAFPHGSCAAALKCVQEIYCTAEGMISPTPVVLSKEQEFSRVPTTDCFDRQAGIVGKCCRDPNYVDPWPSANSLNGFDDGQYKEDPNLGQYFAQRQRPVRSGLTKQTAENKCGVRNPNSTPRGRGLEVNFAEIPWQAMVLRDTNRSLLCGGVIVKTNVVLTAAHCVEGLPTHDILIKGGEWKLGIDEEPLPFQIVKVAAIIRHPGYTPGSYRDDLALLVLEEHLRIAKNIAPICLTPPNQQPLHQCITTGWGKRILQVHLKGAIMRAVDVDLLNAEECKSKVSDAYYNGLICGHSNNDQCDVDYGSALVCTSGDGQYTLTGIFSWDTGCKNPAQIGGYIPADVQWIQTMSAKTLRELKTLDKQYYQ